MTLAKLKPQFVNFGIEGERGWAFEWGCVEIVRYDWGCFVDIGRLKTPRFALRACARWKGTWYDGTRADVIVFVGRWVIGRKGKRYYG